jgi:hypothetical protein
MLTQDCATLVLGYFPLLPPGAVSRNMRQGQERGVAPGMALRIIPTTLGAIVFAVTTPRGADPLVHGNLSVDT